MAWPSSILERSTSVLANANTEADGFIWWIKGQDEVITPTAPTVPVATYKKSRRLAPLDCNALPWGLGDFAILTVSLVVFFTRVAARVCALNVRKCLY